VTDETSKNWLQTLPGILGSLAAFLTALTGLLAVFSGWFTKEAPLRKEKSENCIAGYVWRKAVPDDHVCVTLKTHMQTLEDNMLAGQRRDPKGGQYGANTCLSGFVFRDAFDGDQVCVTVETRTSVEQDNREASNHIAR
jgi:hypothetical protein